jgi:hypothetical protein
VAQTRFLERDLGDVLGGEAPVGGRRGVIVPEVDLVVLVGIAFSGAVPDAAGTVAAVGDAGTGLAPIPAASGTTPAPGARRAVASSFPRRIGGRGRNNRGIERGGVDPRLRHRVVGHRDLLS